MALNAHTKVALVGVGTVGMGWAANYLAKGFTVVATDPSSDARANTERFLRQCWPALQQLGIASSDKPPLDRLHVVATVEDAVTDAGIVHENAPERVDLKQSVIAQIAHAAPADAIIASSSGGIPPSALQAGMTHPGRFMIVHPFNPPHLVPLVEVLGGEQTDPQRIDDVIAFLRGIGKHPIRLDKEKTAYLTNRLQFALLREAVNCLAEGVASAQAIEDAVRYGLAPRWLVMGALTTMTLAGGEGGMQRVLDSFAPAIQSWWDDLGTPRFTPEVRAALLAAQTHITEPHSLAEWIAWRDAQLVPVLRTLAAIGKSPDGATI
jgi:carnitine 3-dehydrogenase